MIVIFVAGAFSLRDKWNLPSEPAGVSTCSEADVNAARSFAANTTLSKVTNLQVSDVESVKVTPGDYTIIDAILLETRVPVDPSTFKYMTILEYSSAYGIRPSVRQHFEDTIRGILKSRLHFEPDGTLSECILRVMWGSRLALTPGQALQVGSPFEISSLMISSISDSFHAIVYDSLVFFLQNPSGIVEAVTSDQMGNSTQISWHSRTLVRHIPNFFGVELLNETLSGNVTLSLRSPPLGLREIHLDISFSTFRDGIMGELMNGRTQLVAGLGSSKILRPGQPLVNEVLRSSVTLIGCSLIQAVIDRSPSGPSFSADVSQDNRELVLSNYSYYDSQGHLSVAFSLYSQGSGTTLISFNPTLNLANNPGLTFVSSLSDIDVSLTIAC
jgi:hypothetical protein